MKLTREAHHREAEKTDSPAVEEVTDTSMDCVGHHGPTTKRPLEVDPYLFSQDGGD